MIELEEGYTWTQEEEGPVVLQSRLLASQGVVHGFSSRLGGVSSGSFSSLNFGLKAGDDPANVQQNLKRLARGVGFDAGQFFRVKQVHGNRVLEISADHDPVQVAKIEADAQITAVPGIALGVLTADCVPVLFADVHGGAVAAAHAGWRGIVSGVLQATLERLFGQYGAAPQTLRVVIGPSIRSCCYEVGAEVADQFRHYPEAVVARGSGQQPHLDLVAAVRHVLTGSGVLPYNLGQSGICTHCHPDLFFSYRRDGGITGHHLSVVGLKRAG